MSPSGDNNRHNSICQNSDALAQQCFDPSIKRGTAELNAALHQCTNPADVRFTLLNFRNNKIVDGFIQLSINFRDGIGSDHIERHA
jgi:hypothetical protein